MGLRYVRPTRVAQRLALCALPLLLAANACWYHVEKYCPHCATVDHDRTDVPPTAPGTTTEVLLVHGSFGFAWEWRPVVDTIRATPGFDLVAWKWPGPFHDPKGDARELRDEIQTLLDGLPPQIDELIVLAHSAGGLLANLAIRGVVVPPGRHMTVALLDPAFWPSVGGRDEYVPLDKGVTATVFFAKEPPAPDGKAPKAPSGVEGTDLPWRYLGKIGHDPMVGKASIPILEARRDAVAAAAASPKPLDAETPALSQ
jgi:hypothetical protein